jgi:CheY-like chemotaxis protein
MRILIVDDCADTAQTFAMILSLRGHTTFVATSAREAIGIALATPPDVLLLDIGLPGRNDGLEICRRVRGGPSGADTLIIAVSGWVSKDQQDAALAAGCDYFLPKPVSLPKLEQAVNRGRRKPPMHAGHEPRSDAEGRIPTVEQERKARS